MLQKRSNSTALDNNPHALFAHPEVDSFERSSTRTRPEEDRGVRPRHADAYPLLPRPRSPARAPCGACSSGGGRTDAQDRVDLSHHAARMVNEALPLPGVFGSEKGGSATRGRARRARGAKSDR